MSAAHAGSRKRWRSLLLLAAFACAIILCSCEPELSVHKLYGRDDVVFDPSLLGTWTVPGSADSQAVMVFEFSSGKPDGYEVIGTYQEYPSAQKITLTFTAQLVKLRDRLFIDVVPTGVQVGDQDSDGPLGIPGHFFGRVSIDGDVLKMSFLDDDWVASHIKAGDISIDSEEVAHKGFVLAAPTQELQQLVLDHADDDQAFSVQLDDLKRQTSAPSSGSTSTPASTLTGAPN